MFNITRDADITHINEALFETISHKWVFILSYISFIVLNICNAFLQTCVINRTNVESVRITSGQRFDA